MTDFRSKITSKNSATIKLHSTVMLSQLLLKILNIFFFIFSESRPDIFSKQLKSSSLNKPTSCLPNSLVRRSSRYKPIFSHNYPS